VPTGVPRGKSRSSAGRRRHSTSRKKRRPPISTLIRETWQGRHRRKALTVATGLLLPVVIFVTGCQPGVQWRLGRFEDARIQAQAQRQLTFVYFRTWYSVECTRFEEEVLKQPRVLEALKGLVAVPLEYDADRDLAQRWSLTQVPAFAIVDPSGNVLASGQGVVSADVLLAAIERARQRMPQTQPDAPR
jgi:thioredoxin-related protein